MHLKNPDGKVWVLGNICFHWWETPSLVYIDI